MHRSLIGSAVLSLVGSAALAQSSVVLYGTVDLNARYSKADGQSRRLSESPGGLNSGQLGFRGSEDLGDGMRARFNLLGDVFADTGTAGATKFFNRTATLSLSTRYGELRLGRDYTPTFLQLTTYDTMGYIGIGAGLNVRQLYAGTRQDNAIEYVLPSALGGLFGAVMATAAEGGSTLDRPTRYLGGRLGYAQGPGTIVAAYATQRFAVPFAVGANLVANSANVVTAVAGDQQKTVNVAGSWDFGVVKLLGTYDRESLKGFREDVGMLDFSVPVGLWEAHGGYDRSRLERANGTKTTIDQWKVTLQYNLSKRTATYGTYSRLDNKNATQLTLPGAAGPAKVGGKSQGVEFGVRHFF